MPMTCYRGDIATPLGRMIAIVDAGGALLRLDFDDDNRQRRSDDLAEQALPDSGAIAAVAEQLGQYFAGRRRTFDLPLAPIGNAFLQSAWAHLIQVPYGTVATYGELAQQLGTAPRAYGRANAINPISIIIPCHRIIGANGKLTGYSGGLQRKAALLALEQGAAEGRGQHLVPRHLLSNN